SSRQRHTVDKRGGNECTQPVALGAGRCKAGALRKENGVRSNVKCLDPTPFHIRPHSTKLSATINFLIMFTRDSPKIAIITLVASLTGFSSAPAQRHGTEPVVETGSPPGLIKKVEPEYPIGFVIHAAKGKGHFRLKINSR